MSTTGNPFGMSNTRAQAAAQLPNFAQLFTADPTYKNFRSLNQQFTQIANAFGQGNSPFSLQDIQEGASAFQQAVNPYAQQFSEQSNREALALRMAEQQQLAAQGQGSPMQQAAFAPPAYSTAFPSSFPQQSPYSNFYGSPQLQSAINSRYGGGNQNVIPLEGRFGLVRLAGGGEVSEARRMLQNLQNANEVQAGQMINRFAGGGYAAGRFNRAMVEPDAITGRGDRNLFELFDRNDRAMIAPVGPNEDGGFGPPAYTAPAPAPIAEPLPPPVAEPLPPPVAEPLPPPVAEPLPPPVAEPQLQKDGFLPLLRPVLPPAPVEQVQRLIQEGRVPSNYVTGPYDAQGLSDEDMTRWIASTYEPGGANAPGALPYIFAPDYVDPLQKAYEQAQENAARAYQEVLDKRAAEQPPSPPPMAEPLPPPVAEPLPPPVAEPTPEPPPVAEPPGGIVTLPERPPVAELPRVISPEPPPAIPEPPPPITLPEIKERPVEPIKVPKVDEEFRSSPVRSFDPVTGSFRYTPPTKLDSATGAGTTWTPPTITSRKRQLLNVDYLPGIDVPQYDPLTNQLYQPALSASQRFAGDRNMQMAALQQLKTASPMSSATYLALQSRLRAGEFGGIGGQPVDMERLKAAATAMAPPVLGLKIGSLSDTAGGSQGSNVPAGFGSGVPVTLGVPTIGRKDGGEVSTEDFIKKQSGGDVSRGTASPNTAEVPKVDTEGRLIDEREDIRSESQRMLNRLQSQPSKLPPGLRRTVAATREQGKESMFPVAAPARDFLSGILGASPTAPGSQAYRTGQAIANMPPVQAAAAIPAKVAASAGDAATALAAMGPAMGAVMKPKGGNWLAPSVERGLNYLIPRTGAGNRTAKETLEEMNRTYPAEELARMSPETRASVDRAYQWLEPNVAVQNWIEKKLIKYVKNEMATPEDPVRALAERGILHVDPEQLNSYPGAGNPTNQAVARRALGYPEEGLAKSEAAKRWETASDYMIQTDRALNLLNPKEYGQGFVDQTLAANPWLTKVDPYERIYGVDTLNYRPDYSELGFDHLIDELKNSLNPNSGLPRALQLTPKQLDKVSVPQAVELVDKINKWRAEQKAAADLKRSQNAATVEYKAYDTIPGTTEPNQRGLRWVELRTPEITSADQLTPEAKAKYQWYLTTGVGEEAALRQAAKHDESLAESLKYEGEVMGHCVGGYCPDVESGRSRIYSLRDKKGEPHVTVEVEPRPTYTEEDVIQQFPGGVTDAMRKGDVGGRNYIAQKLTELNSAGLDKIIQIKGKANRAPKDEYLPFVQDFVRSGQWSSVGDFKNTGLIRKSDYIDTFTPEMLDSVGVGEYMTREEFNQLADKLGGINKMATGGAVRMKDGGEVIVSRGTSTSKQQLDKLAQVSKRKKA